MVYMQGFKCFPIKTTLIPFLTQESLIENFLVYFIKKACTGGLGIGGGGYK